jgi:hypothetical protein
MNQGKRSAEFTELAEFTIGGPDQPQLSHKRNVIKSRQVVRKGVQEVGLNETNQEDPLLLVERDGDRVTGVEFLCKCGRSASLKLEYDDV